MILERYAQQLRKNGILPKMEIFYPSISCPTVTKICGGNAKTATNGNQVSNLEHEVPDVPYAAIVGFGTDA